MKPSFTHSLIHSFILGAIAAITLTLASCEQNAPEEPFSFQFEVQKLTIDSAVILLTPSATNVEFFWAHVTQKYLNDHYNSISHYVTDQLSRSTYRALKETGRVTKGTQLYEFADLKDNTAYRLIVCQVDTSLNIIGEPVSRKYTTLVDPTQPEVINGMLPAVFSIGEETEVHFSQGNLQYQASTNTWRFALNQYDMVGVDNAYISDTYDGWIDLFGGNTANNPTLASTEDADYAGDFVDWGVNKIANGGNQANMWRTLTIAEWKYLYLSRQNAINLCGIATVAGVHGLVILPDDWVKPSTNLVFYGRAHDWNTNVYSASDWTKMEAHGAVFLPATGYRKGTEVGNVGKDACYWTSTRMGPEVEFCLDFNVSGVSYKYGSNRNCARSVRLVH